MSRIVCLFRRIGGVWTIGIYMELGWLGKEWTFYDLFRGGISLVVRLIPVSVLPPLCFVVQTGCPWP